MTLAALAIAAILNPTRVSADSPDDWIERGHEAAAEGKTEEVGRCLGKAARIAHSAGDLGAESRVADRVRTLVWGRYLSFTTSRFEEKDRRAFLTALVPLMEELDPKHGGVFVSAHDLAYEILAIGTRTGVREGLEAAAEAVKTWRRAGRAGAYGDVLHDYARGVLALPPGGDPAAALAALTRALDACRKHGWREMGAFVACEIACLHLTRGDLAAAESVLDESVWTVVGPGREGPFWKKVTRCIEVKRIWRWMLAARVGPRHPALHARVAEALSGVAVTGDDLPPTDTKDRGYWHGAMARGGRNVPDADRDLVRARARTGRALLTVRRKGPWLILTGLGTVDTKRVGVLDGQESFALTGLRVGTCFANVCVQRMSLETEDRGAFAGCYRDEAKCWYLLAPGEKLLVTRRGAVVR